MTNCSNICVGLVKIGKNGEESEAPTKTPIPLISVAVNASVVQAVAQVEVTQVYVNREEQPIEAIYYFPVNPEGAVTHFQAELDGKIIKGTVKSRKEAQEIYDRAVAGKKTALLGEETKPDIFKIRVGFLKPGAQAKVIIGYVTEVKTDPGSNAIRFYIPTTVAPRYVSPTETDANAEDIKKMTFSPSSPAPLSLTVAVSLQGKMRSIESPTHAIKVEKLGAILENQAWDKAIVELSGEITDMDRDFVLTILPEENHQPRLYSEKMDDGSVAMMLHLVPSFKLEEQKAEIVFMLDQSGSMKGPSINLAKKALMNFLRGMPADCYFNVVGFGTNFQVLFPSSMKNDETTLQQAINHAKNLQANLGGTEILEPLKNICGIPSIKGYLRQIFILTDGQVADTDRVIGLAKANAHTTRIFALGIGDAVSHHLVEGIAKAGGGTADFVAYNEDIDRKILNQLKNGLQPSLTEVGVEWEGINFFPDAESPNVNINREKTLLGYNKPVVPEPGTPNEECQQSPKRIPPVYDGSQLLVFGIFKNKVPTSATITAQSPDGPLSVTVKHCPESDLASTGMLHRLAAIKLVRELELEMNTLHFTDFTNQPKLAEKLEKEIIGISCQYGVTSRYTSFVAIDLDEDKPAPDHWDMQSRPVPVQFPNGWHGVTRMLSYDYSWEEQHVVLNKKLVSSLSQDISAKRERTCSEPETPTLPILSLQSADGSFKLDDRLCALLGKTLEYLKEVASHHNLPEPILATALVLSYVQTTSASRKYSCARYILRAHRWMKKELVFEKFKNVFELANKLLHKP